MAAPSSIRIRNSNRFQQERSLLRPLPSIPFDTDEVVPTVVSPHARIEFDGNRYSVPPQFARRPITVRATRDEVRLLHEGQTVAQHVRCHERKQVLVLPDHRVAALALRHRSYQCSLEQEFDALGPQACEFHLKLNERPVKTSIHLRRLLGLAQLYGRTEVLAAIARALELKTYDAASVENLLLAERRRQQRALERRLQESRLPKQKTLAAYEFGFPKRVPKAAILRLFDCDFIDQHGCAVLIGPTGTGKTHLLTALGHTACERGYSVRYVRVVDMLNHLIAAQISGLLGKALKTYIRPTLLLLDELGYLPIDKRGADLLFQVVAARYETGSIVLTTNRAFREWGTLLDVDNTLATALIDRLMHHGEAIVIRGDSDRMKDKPSDPPESV